MWFWYSVNQYNEVCISNTFDDVNMMIFGCDGREYADKLSAEVLQAKASMSDKAPIKTTPLVLT